MVVRLGFAIVASLRPDLLITDEILAVGDEAFQRKCVRWIEQYLEGGGTLILVSHSMYHVQKLCRQALWLKQGRVAASGDVQSVTQAYLAYQEGKSATPAADARAEVAARNLEFHMLELAFDGDAAATEYALVQGAELRVRARVHSRDDRVPVLVVGIVRADGTPVYGVSTEMDGTTMRRESDKTYSAEITFAQLPLLPGSYVVRAHPMDPEAVRLFDTLERGLTVRGASRELGLVRLPHRWSES
jgi:lipopolysaccharide transport system ATP-binding protein